ncbi:MAG: ATP-dependent RNA helicase [Alteromonas sp.]|nr:ATP-dependent RNA helicase [Alteromonas sp.]MAY23543.1 ATP-dependent RNA helicase [Flavobacteriaceae bacterium]|tara:strand:- start:17497 stop:19290 length:1794 start_codon:yes stop_codon:yes gene_type:complete
MTTFQSLGLEEHLLQAINDLGFETPSEVQEKTIPILLEQETDIVSLAQTGTGKTAAFGFPMLQKIDVNSRTTQGLILSPTRELCLQITSELKLYGKYLNGLNVVAIYGGASISEQARQIKKGAQIIVATPGRMKDMIGRNMIDISKIEYCVLDEADEMLNMGFYEDITDILSHSPKDKSTWLFSATMPKEVATIAKKFMHQPLEVTVGSKNVGADTVTHEYFLVNARDRYQALKRLADANPDIFSVVFCRTKRDTQKVAEMLIEDGYNAAALHGDLSQNQRDLVMKSFRTRQIQMLVATDVAARGIDVDDITHVINYQLPDEIETYTHRSGRTGRAGKTGVSMVIVSKSEQRKIKQIEKIIQKSFIKKEVPSGIEICERQLFHLANNIKDTEINHEIDIYLPKINEVLEGFSKEELIKKVFSVEFTRFYNYYKKAKDLNVEGGKDTSGEDFSKKYSEDSTRYFINLGRKDGLQWMDLKDLIREITDLGKDDVFHVDTMETFSFFNTDSAHIDKVLEAFKGVQFNDRNVDIEISKDKGGRNRGGGKGGNRGKGKGHRKGGGGKRGKFNDDRPKFKGKSRRKESRPKEKGTGGKRRRRM